MDTSKVKQMLSTEDIICLVTEGLGSNGNLWDASGAPIFQTVCHNSPGYGSYKLYYYPDSQMFYCYTECGSMDFLTTKQSAIKCEIRWRFIYLSYVPSQFDMTVECSAACLE